MYDDFLKLYESRIKDTPMPFKKFLWHEKRKNFQGKFMNTDFFIRYVKDWDEIKEEYGDIIYKNQGSIKIKAIIKDDSEAIFTPCSYKISNVEFIDKHLNPQIKYVSSFRGRFCEQVKIGEKIIAQGKLEKVTNSKEEYYRLLVGNKKEDFLITTN